MTTRTKVLSTMLLLVATSCGGEQADEQPRATFEGTIVVATNVEVQGPSGTTMASEISLVDAQGTHPLTSDGAIRDASPAWSPDGTQIAYITIDMQLAVIDRDGTGGATLTAKTADQSLWPRHPQWLPNGNITVEVGGTLSVFGPDGTEVAVLTPPDFTDRYTLAPDGRQVAYDCSTSISSEICVFDLQTGEGRSLLTTPRPFFSLAWSPDGTQIVAGGSTGAEDLPVDAAHEDLFVFAADGSGLHALSLPGNEANPVWSPDGTQIVFNSYTGSGSDTELGLWLMNADGSEATRLLRSAAVQPDWSTT